MDCAVVPLKRHGGGEYLLAQTVDFFYPLVNDPEVLGGITLANVLSDLYAVGVTDIDSLEMIISVSTEFTDKQRDVVTSLILQGFRKALARNGYNRINLKLRQLKLNPWCIIGGVATSVCIKDEIVFPTNGRAGDALVLTKPLGTQLATNAHIWQTNKTDKYKILRTQFTDNEILETFEMALKSMSYLNKNAALLMHKYQAHCATDVTGFGLLGHAGNLAQYQTDKVLFKINKLPIIKNVVKFSKLIDQSTKLLSGKVVETSGGLLIALPPEAADQFCCEFNEITKGEQKAFKIGYAEAASESDAELADNVEYIEVSL
ncbi:blast:Selenide%2C water dikinase 2 [Drosophila guanche]|uniref:Blast:Selenide, water dikinase 2 n=2 Tax=Drosophila guanche TaxID=7266 RepID=A0A3B0JKA7_DROGU|nr:blast:Selenide%2C water dikinase 2 [Drosophila guanche]